MKKRLTLSCVFLLAACSGNASETQSGASEEMVETGTQAIELIENADRSAMRDCDDLAVACESMAELAEHCREIAEHCAAFGDFLGRSGGPAKACWRGCTEGDCDTEACGELTHRHVEGRGHGLRCLDELESSFDAPEGFGTACQDIEFEGPFGPMGRPGRGPGGHPDLGDAGPPGPPDGVPGNEFAGGERPEGPDGEWEESGPDGEWDDGEEPDGEWDDEGRPDGEWGEGQGPDGDWGGGRPDGDAGAGRPFDN